MTEDEATLPGEVDRSPGPDTSARFDAAIRGVGELAMALSAALSSVNFSDALRLRGELGAALSRAASLAALRDPAERDAAVQRLVAMRAVVSRLLENAPAPSAAAIAAANAGNRTALSREAEAWIAERRASGTTPRGRSRRNTEPASPKAWSARRDAGPYAVDAPADAARVASTSTSEDHAQ